MTNMAQQWNHKKALLKEDLKRIYASTGSIPARLVEKVALLDLASKRCKESWSGIVVYPPVVKEKSYWMALNDILHPRDDVSYWGFGDDELIPEWQCEECGYKVESWENPVECDFCGWDVMEDKNV